MHAYPVYHLLYERDAAPNGKPRLTLCNDLTADEIECVVNGDASPIACAHIVRAMLTLCGGQLILHPQSDALPSINRS